MLSLLCKPFKLLFASNKNTDQIADLDVDVDVDVDVLEKEYVIHPYMRNNLDDKTIAKLSELNIEPISDSTKDEINQSNTIDKLYSKTEYEPKLSSIQDIINKDGFMDNQSVSPSSSIVIPYSHDIISANTDDKLNEHFFIEHLVDESMKKHGLHQNKKQRRKYKGKNNKQQKKKQNKNKKQKKLQQYKTKKQHKVAKKLRVQAKPAYHNYNLRSKVKMLE
jgi:hypothetical protein